MYNCRVYLNSGFNATNRPDKPSLLDAVDFVDFSALDILQDAGLNSVRINATWDQIKAADFCKIGDWYYAILGRQMNDPATATLTLDPDAILSAGGVSELTFLDGITERVHVAKSADVFGAYTEDDPLTAPARPLELESNVLDPASETHVVNEYVTMLETTIDLIATATSDASTDYTSGSDNVVTVPDYVPASAVTIHQYGGAHATLTYAIDYSGASDATSKVIREGIQKARALGVESAIIAQYRVPSAFLTSIGLTNSGAISRMYFNPFSTASASPDYIQSASAKNMRVNYGSYTKYGILTTGGNKVEYNAEDIFDGTNNRAPLVTMRADLRADGCPYYRFEYYLGQDSDDNYFQNSVAGAEWERVPLVYTEKSGNALNKQVYDTERDISYNKENRALLQGAIDVVKNAGQKADGNILQLAGGILGGIPSFAYESYSSIKDYSEREELAALQYGQSQVVAPEINFPYNGAIMRDYYKNGAIIYRYKYSDFDATRIDRLLTMYGYRVTKALESADFTNRAKFNFVRANGVSIGNLPAWWADMCAAQLERGIRFWHVLPDTKYYTDGTNI